MAEETTHSTVTADDLDVLRILLHTIRGISPVSSSELVPVSVDEQS